MPAPQFVHLRVHSDFSMVDGLAKTKPIVAKAEELQMPALAITDQMNLCGLVRFYGAAHGAAPHAALSSSSSPAEFSTNKSGEGKKGSL